MLNRNKMFDFGCKSYILFDHKQKSLIDHKVDIKIKASRIFRLAFYVLALIP